MLQKQYATLIAILCTLVPSSILKAELILNGGFESQPNFGSGTAGNDGSFSGMTGSQIPGWIVENGHAATIHNTGYPVISGNYSLNLDGEGFNGLNGNIYQDFASDTLPQYAIDYDYQGWFSSATTFTVSITDTANSSLLYSQTSNWTASLVHVHATFQGTGNILRLRVEQATTGVNDNAFIADNFSVAAITSVPEPSSMTCVIVTALFCLWRSTKLKSDKHHHC